MYSALKQDGQRLYELARKGRTAEIPKREVTVHSLELQSMTENHGALLKVRCSKGFYVRTLCNDLGEALNCPAHMRFLLRAESGVFTLQTAVTLERLRQAKESDDLETLLLPPETVLRHLPWLDTPARLEKPLRNGGKLPVSAFEGGEKVPEGGDACLWLSGELMGVAVGRTMNGRFAPGWASEGIKMKVILNGKHSEESSVLALGMFDGVHIGHQVLLERRGRCICAGARHWWSAPLPGTLWS